jgi:para-aminobenzoate synthetase component 1
MRPGQLCLTLPGWTDPENAFIALFGDRTDVVWLDSGRDAARGVSYIGAASRVLRSDRADRPVLDILRDDLGSARASFAESRSSDAPVPDEGFALGWVGWLGYEMRHSTMDVPRTRQFRYPDAALLYLDRVIGFEHATSTVFLLAIGQSWDGELGDWRDEVTEALARAEVVSADTERHVDPATQRDPATPPDPPANRAQWRHSDAEYLSMIAECQGAIAAGEAYQLCLTTEARVDGIYDPVAHYRALRAASPSHHGGLVRVGDVALLSSSPEVFLSIGTDRSVRSSPIKGTRARGVTAEDDARLRAELLASDKERAENLMIVDLMRNDIGRVSEIGSVEVTSLLAVESYAQVHQLVSTVRGRLRPDLDPLDAVVACFPAGSMTGAPKRNATLILDGLERSARGIYAGAFGYFGLDGRVELAMVIRSIVIDPLGATVGAGGGITALSSPEEELAEVQLKARALLRVLGAE